MRQQQFRTQQETFVPAITEYAINQEAHFELVTDTVFELGGNDAIRTVNPDTGRFRRVSA